MEGKYKVITLCGSTRFKEAFLETQKGLTLEGNIVMEVDSRIRPSQVLSLRTYRRTPGVIALSIMTRVEFGEFRVQRRGARRRRRNG